MPNTPQHLPRYKMDGVPIPERISRLRELRDAIRNERQVIRDTWRALRRMGLAGK